jgi:prepilin-type N-terminal cleavage/methylation domain-containing protein
MKVVNSKISQRAFTLVEIMVIVAILGILVALSISGFLRSRQRAQSRMIINSARVIDHAIDQWAITHGQSNGAVINCASVSIFIKDGKLKSKVAALGNRGGNIKEVLTVNTITIGNVGSLQVRIHNQAKNALPAIKDWGGY